MVIYGTIDNAELSVIERSAESFVLLKDSENSFIIYLIMTKYNSDMFVFWDCVAYLLMPMQVLQYSFGPNVTGDTFWPISSVISLLASLQSPNGGYV